MRQVALIALLLGGCTPPDVAPTKLAELRLPPDSVLEAAPPLPDVPACDHLKTQKDRLDCRSRYDIAVRRQYVGVASDKATLAAWVREVAKPAPASTVSAR